MLMASLSTLLAPMFTRSKNRPTKIDSDGELLREFARSGSEAAFEELVRRHGSLVLGVCQRMLSNHHDAEDAFQATWIVLAKKARSVHKPEQLSHWLYGVARHAALNVRKMRKRRNNREHALGESTDVADPRTTSWNETRPMLDDEVARLPEKYRLPVLLCCLQGLSHQEAARQLAWPIGTVAGRLSRGKELLRKRLLKRGVMISPTVLSLCLAQDVLAAKPSEALVASTLGQLFVGSSVGIGGVAQSPMLLAIAQGVIKDLFLIRLMQVMVVIAGVALACAGIGYGWRAISTDSTFTAQTPPLISTLSLPMGNPRYVHLPLDPQAIVLRLTHDDTEGEQSDIELTVLADGRIRGSIYDNDLKCMVPLEDRLSPHELQELMQFVVHDQKVFSLDARAAWKKIKEEFDFEGDLRAPADTTLTSLEVQTADQKYELCWCQLGATEAWFHEVPEVRRIMAIYRRLRHQLTLMQAGGEARTAPIVQAVNQELKKVYPHLADLECKHLARYIEGEEGMSPRWVFTRGNMFYDDDFFSVTSKVRPDGRMSLEGISFGQSTKRPTMKRREGPRPPS